MTTSLPHQKATQESIVSVHHWNENLFTFTTTRPPNYSFTAGQYARLGLNGNNEIIWRAYSMTSAPHEDYLEFYGILVPGGLFTSRLGEMKPGDPIWIDKQSYGFMTVDRFTDGNDLWMLATGTGIGPFLSILRDVNVWVQFRNLILVHCVRHANELTYHEQLSAIEKHAASRNEAHLKTIYCTTRESKTVEPAQVRGRITTLLENGELEQKAGIKLTPEASRLMMCGNPDMIEDTRRILHHRGFRPCRRALPGQFVTENYW